MSQAQMKLMDVLLSPHVTEKTARAADAANQVVFKVRPEADKADIKKAVEMMFEVKVASVRIANMKGKRKRFAFMQGRRKNWKKAYVTLEKGHDIDFMGGE